MTILESVALPSHLAGDWKIDPVHSEVSFTIRHLMLSKVRGSFTDFHGSFVAADDPLESSVEATIQLASIPAIRPRHPSVTPAPVSRRQVRSTATTSASSSTRRSRAVVSVSVARCRSRSRSRPSCKRPTALPPREQRPDLGRRACISVDSSLISLIPISLSDKQLACT
jgi:hypothetical protein